MILRPLAYEANDHVSGNIELPLGTLRSVTSGQVGRFGLVASSSGGREHCSIELNACWVHGTRAVPDSCTRASNMSRSQTQSTDGGQ